MRLVLATSGFAQPGGSESYLLTTGEQLERLGHSVTIRATELGAIAEEAESRGVRVVAPGAEPRQAPDAILVQDSPSAYELAELWPSVPQVFRACTDVYDFQLPPVLPGVVSCVVTVCERVAARVRALPTSYELIRLRHPIDVRRFAPLLPIGERPRRAVILGNYLQGPRLQALTAAWEAAGVECVRVPGPSGPTLAPELAMNDADIVVGKARVVLEAMACGRAAYVYDFAGRDGWVTPETYPAMEADNFAGMATDAGIDAHALEADIEAYDARMGDVNRDLAVRHHDAARHAEALVALFRRLAHGSPVAAPTEELARLGRRQWAFERETMLLRSELARRTADLERRAAERDAASAARDAVEAELSAWVRRAHGAEAEIERLQAELATRRVRLGIAVGRAADSLRIRR